MWVVGAYHPLTKHLNLVAEYSEVTGSADNRATTGSYSATTGVLTKSTTAGHQEGKTQTVSLGAILFF